MSQSLLDHVNFAMKKMRWDDWRIYQFDFDRLRQRVKKYWFTNLLNMVPNSNEICQICFLSTSNNTFWPFYIIVNSYRSFAFLFQISTYAGSNKTERVVILYRLRTDWPPGQWVLMLMSRLSKPKPLTNRSPLCKLCVDCHRLFINYKVFR